ncbi:MAG: glycoside hydrolase family 15 protein [Frankiaceae bacterium]
MVRRAAPERVDGFAPIGGYAGIGDGRTVALVALDGCIDWWPLPTIDSPPAFAAILDPAHGGYVELAPDEPYEVSRRYVGDSNVLETTYHARSGDVRVTDALTVGRAGRLPWGELARRVEAVGGDAVPMRWAVVPGTRFGSAAPWFETRQGSVLVHVGDQHLAVRCRHVGSPVVRDGRVSGRFVARSGERGLLALAGADDGPLFLAAPAAVDDRIDRTVASWDDWARQIAYQGPWRTEVVRSALALKLLLHSPTGAIAAAPTTSLPERIGGDKNWDYRYMWVRDASFTLDAFISLGLHEEVQAAVSWLIGSLHRTAPRLQVFYKLDGTVPGAQELLDLPGYRGSRPVRSGNDAAGQTQLGTLGDLFDTIWRYVGHGHVLDPRTGQLLADLADHCCDVWRTEDSGIWELQQHRHYTVSKMGCWAALDRALRLHDAGMVPTGHRHRWIGERAAIRRFVDEHCWSAAKRSYTFYAGTDELDAATLLAGRSGFDTGERLAGTVAAVRAELGAGPYLYRYTGMAEEEGAFVACSFWLANALAVLGRPKEAAEAIDGALGAANDVGLLAEMVDPATGELLGNFPQGLSHLALVGAVMAQQRAAGCA